MSLSAIIRTGALLLFSFASQSNGQSSNCSQTLPTLQIALFVHPDNKLDVLPYALTALQKQDYPADRIRLYVYTELYESVASHTWSASRPDSRLLKNARTLQALKLWIDQVRSRYADVILHVQHESIAMIDSINADSSNESLYWSDARFEKLIRLRMLAMKHAKQNWADLLLFLDVDVILTNRTALSQVIDHNGHSAAVFGPVLQSIGTYSNFWAGITQDGYYERTERYLPILHRESIDVSHLVPMLHSCFFVNLRCASSRSLSFRPSDVSNAPLDDMIAFGLSARSAEIEMHADNRFVYGFLMPPIDHPDPIEIKQQWLSLHLKHLYETGQTLSIDPSLESFVDRLPIEPLHNIERLFVINLKRRSDRRKRMQSVLNLLGISGEFWTAIDGAQLSMTTNFLKTHNISLLQNYRDPYHDRPMTAGEVGCFLSHYHVWRHMLHQNWTQIVILEDDARLDFDFQTGLRRLLDSLTNTSFDFVYLGRKAQSTTQLEPAVNAWAVRPAYSYWTVGYVLRRSGARKLIDADPLSRLLPVDEFLPIMYDRHPNREWSDRFERRNLIALSAKPLLVHPSHYIGDDEYVSDTEQSPLIETHVEL